MRLLRDIMEPTSFLLLLVIIEVADNKSPGTITVLQKLYISTS